MNFPSFRQGKVNSFFSLPSVYSIYYPYMRFSPSQPIIDSHKNLYDLCGKKSIIIPRLLKNNLEILCIIPVTVNSLSDALLIFHPLWKGKGNSFFFIGSISILYLLSFSPYMRFSPSQPIDSDKNLYALYGEKTL